MPTMEHVHLLMSNMVSDACVHRVMLVRGVNSEERAATQVFTSIEKLRAKVMHTLYMICEILQLFV